MGGGSSKGTHFKLIFFSPRKCFRKTNITMARGMRGANEIPYLYTRYSTLYSLHTLPTYTIGRTLYVVTGSKVFQLTMTDVSQVLRVEITRTLAESEARTGGFTLYIVTISKNEYKVESVIIQVGAETLKPIIELY